MIDMVGWLHFDGIATSAYSFPRSAAGSFPFKTGPHMPNILRMTSKLVNHHNT